MKVAYDKLLFGMGMLVLLAGIAFSMINSSSSISASAGIDPLGSEQYESIPVPDFDETLSLWPNATEQAPGELYDVFTPPAIWIDKDGTFIFESPIDDLPLMPFGVYLAQLENEPYRIQLEGYVEEDFNDPKKSVLLLYDEEKKKQIRARVGESVKEHEFAVYDFTIDRVRDSNAIFKYAIATILDFRDGRRVFLNHRERKYKESTTVVLRSMEDTSFEIRINQTLPYEFETLTAKYILEKINLEESSVIVTRMEDGDIKSETKRLYLKPPETTEKSLEPELKPDDNNVFDFDF